MKATGAISCGLLVVAVACGDVETPPDAPVATATEALVTAADTSRVPAPDTNRVSPILIALDGEGLMLVDSLTGSTRHIAFGVPAGDAIAAVSLVDGPPLSRGVIHDCGAGPVEFVAYGGVQVMVLEGRFAGWTAARGAPDTLQTMSGVGLGSTRAALESAYATTVTQTTLGMEFVAGGLQGVFESGAPSGRITDLWAGTSCVAR